MSETEELITKRNAILILVDEIYYTKMTRSEIDRKVFRVNLRLRDFPEGTVKESIFEKIKMKYRYAPLMNDTGILDYTGHGRPHFY